MKMVHVVATKKPTISQRGAALTVSLIFLLIMTLIGVTSLRNTVLEERMAGNLRDRQIAFEAAEAGIRGAEAYIDNNVITLAGFDANGDDGLYSESVDLDGDGDVDGDDAQIWRHVNWSGTGPLVYSYDAVGESGGPGSNPLFVIEHYGTVTSEENKLNIGNYGEGTGAGNVDLFRITVRATGGSDNAVVILQSTYGKRL
ncbi:hypothetical protein H0Z60_05560 [Ectothiorhodospiraceae bacterium WFHF3C12]|nr:hypothetical protein [Ectothiorhodospiraceae bacterium WFHF3C12]